MVGVDVVVVGGGAIGLNGANVVGDNVIGTAMGKLVGIVVATPFNGAGVTTAGAAVVGTPTTGAGVTIGADVVPPTGTGAPPEQPHDMPGAICPDDRNRWLLQYLDPRYVLGALH